MRKRAARGSLSALVIATLAITTATAGENLLENPGFEQQLEGWSVSEGTAVYTADASSAFAGSYCAKGIESDPGSLGRLYQDVTSQVVVGGEYKISGWMKTESSWGEVAIGLDYVAAGGWTPWDGYIYELHTGSTATWTHYASGCFTVPPMPADASALWFLFDFNGSAGTAYFDDVRLEECSAVEPPIQVKKFKAKPHAPKVDKKITVRLKLKNMSAESLTVIPQLQVEGSGAVVLQSPPTGLVVTMTGKKHRSAQFKWVYVAERPGTVVFRGLVDVEGYAPMEDLVAAAVEIRE